MKTKTAGMLGIGALCTLAWMPVAWGAIQVIQKSAEYKIVVGPATVGDTASLLIAWDSEDRGENFADWANSRVVSTALPADGGDFYTPLEGIPEGSVVRAFAKQTFKLLDDDGYVELSGNQYFQTDIKENETSGMEMTFVMMGGSAWCPLMAGTHDGFTIGRRNTDRNRTYIRCHDGNEIGAYAVFTEGGKTILSLR